MAGREGSHLTKAREVGFGETVAGQMQHGVLEGTGVTIGQNEPVPINPVRIFTAVLHNLGPQHVGHGGTPHGSAGMARISRLRLVGRNGPDRIDAQEFIGRGRGGCCCHDIDCCISFYGTTVAFSMGKVGFVGWVQVRLAGDNQGKKSSRFSVQSSRIFRKNAGPVSRFSVEFLGTCPRVRISERKSRSEPAPGTSFAEGIPVVSA
jgi:hypothetical protein